VLAGLPKGSYTVRIVTRTNRGRTSTEIRRYRTCVPKSSAQLSGRRSPAQAHVCAGDPGRCARLPHQATPERRECAHARVRRRRSGHGQKLKTYPTISDEDLKAAIGRAYEAHRSWNASTTAEDRAALIGRVAELHTERREELANIIVREMGKPIEQALGEVDFCVAIYQFYADNALELLADEPIKLLDGEGSAFVRKSSYGVLLGIMPWNYPYYQVARFAGPNLVIGNTVLLKHAPQCPESAAAMEQIFHDAGVPRTPTSTSTPPTSRSSRSSPTRACAASR
jgi:acyl-CoA reductase-like NAD-dependent aldehyde dehydrogenase